MKYKTITLNLLNSKQDIRISSTLWEDLLYNQSTSNENVLKRY